MDVTKQNDWCPVHDTDMKTRVVLRFSSFVQTEAKANCVCLVFDSAVKKTCWRLGGLNSHSGANTRVLNVQILLRHFTSCHIVKVKTPSTVYNGDFVCYNSENRAVAAPHQRVAHFQCSLCEKTTSVFRLRIIRCSRTLTVEFNTGAKSTLNWFNVQIILDCH